MADRKLLLSIDGGGIRGIIPICMLMSLEEATGKLARETFSFIAGTSTGAIICASIAAGIPATRMLDLYLNRGGEVFSRRPWRLAQRILLGYMYSARKLNRVLASEAGPAVAWTINDSPVDIMITAKRVDDGMPWYFVKDGPRNSRRTGKFSLLDCVTASAVAPTYFEPWEVAEREPPPGERPAGKMVDGGVGVAGNPAYQACVEAFWYAERYSPQNTAVVSLGTGRFQTNQSPGGLFAILPWINWTIGELLDSANEQQTDLVQRHFPEMPLYRLAPDLRAFEPSLKKGIGQDDVTALPLLRRIGDKFAATIDWPAILDGTDNRFLVTPEKTQVAQYQTA